MPLAGSGAQSTDSRFMALFGQIGDEGFHLGPFVGDEEELHGEFLFGLVWRLMAL